MHSVGLRQARPIGLGVRGGGTSAVEMSHVIAFDANTAACDAATRGADAATRGADAATRGADAATAGRTDGGRSRRRRQHWPSATTPI
jgi:hypothetical protein